MDATDILQQLRQLGVTVTVNENRLRLQPGSRVTPELAAALRRLKPQVLAELERKPPDSFYCWILEEWRRTSIPQWRHILQAAQAAGDADRADYARWMLQEVLVDSEYEGYDAEDKL